MLCATFGIFSLVLFTATTTSPPPREFVFPFFLPKKAETKTKRDERRTIIFLLLPRSGNVWRWALAGGLLLLRLLLRLLLLYLPQWEIMPFAKGLTGPSWLVHSLSTFLPLYLPSTMNNDPQPKSQATWTRYCHFVFSLLQSLLQSQRALNSGNLLTGNDILLLLHLQQQQQK